MDGLLSKSEALYFEPESIGSPDGARCNICWKFDPIGKLCLEVAGDINGPHGICGLYVHGTPRGNIPIGYLRKVSKAEAGYSEDGPTHCGNCDEMIERKLNGTSPCERVRGLVDGKACCDVWEVEGK